MNMLYILVFGMILGISSLSLAASKSTPKKIRIYLAGPEVFLEDPKEVGRRNKKLLEKLNKRSAKVQFSGIYPLDSSLDENNQPFKNQIESFSNDKKTGYAIFRKDREMMEKSDIILANIVPFKGAAHMDSGTAFEIGYFHSAGRPVVLYQDASLFYKDAAKGSPTMKEKELRLFSESIRKDSEGSLRDKYGLQVEDFGMEENLMIVSPYLELMRKYGLASEVPESLEKGLDIVYALWERGHFGKNMPKRRCRNAFL